MHSEDVLHRVPEHVGRLLPAVCVEVVIDQEASVLALGHGVDQIQSMCLLGRELYDAVLDLIVQLVDVGHDRCQLVIRC